MLDHASCKVELIEGQRVTCRGLAFLICGKDKNINAKSKFDTLSEVREREVRTSFDAWLDGKNIESRFHGWNEPDYKECFCFKWKEKRLRHRLYGFLCNPNFHSTNFRLCVLAIHVTKIQHETDKTELDRLNALRTNEEIIKKTRVIFSGPQRSK